MHSVRSGRELLPQFTHFPAALRSTYLALRLAAHRPHSVLPGRGLFRPHAPHMPAALRLLYRSACLAACRTQYRPARAALHEPHHDMPSSALALPHTTHTPAALRSR